MTQDEYIISLATRYNFNLNRLNNSVRFYSKDGNQIIELSKEYLKDCQDKCIEPKELIDYKKIVSEIENIMERWNLGRENDTETLENINEIMFKIGRQTFFKAKVKPVNPEDDCC